MRSEHTRQVTRAVTRTLIIVIISLLMIDAFLYHFDPLGVVAARHAQATFFLLMELHPSGYRLRTGQHYIHNYTMTITEEGCRAVPDSAGSDCTLAAIGDSATLGIGVDDQNTWVNLLAQQVPDASWINAGRSDYSAGNVWPLLQNTPANGYVWLIIANDSITPLIGPTILPDTVNVYFPATRLYLGYVETLLQSGRDSVAQPDRPVDLDQYWEYADHILTYPNVIAFAFSDNDLGINTANRYDNVHLLPPFTARISAADGHPSVQGHQQIADEMLPYIQEFARTVCAV